ncbi:hypothetical protein RHGRI_008624 [Rhododendron griersonianum]|uniref:Pyruvate kinase n=1 Tax=Rhododendron griersonianum TaxID=479676 RepID=A0AAV6L1F8_9ERIC|nr:hypothetical protein RHGRI_008624 [Rhododendron griersonianum]
MAQVAAAIRPIHSSLASPSSVSLQTQFQNIKPSSFSSKVQAPASRKSHRTFRIASPIAATISTSEVIPVSPVDVPKIEEQIQQLGETSVSLWSKPIARRKTKIICTIGPSTNTREMIWKLAEAGMNVARLNMSHGDHASHQKVIDLIKEYNAQCEGNVIAIMLDTKGPEVRSGDLPQPITLVTGQEFSFTIRRGVGTADCVSVNYDDFVNDVEAGDMLLVDGGMMSLMVKSKTGDSVKCEVVDGGELQSRRHLNVRGKSATLPSITEKDWDDIKFGVDNKVDFYAVSFVKDAEVVYELQSYLQSFGADIHVIVKIESADAIPNLHSIITASDGAMVARGDLGAELPVEEVPLLQDEIIKICRSMGKAVIVATNMLESMIVHPTPTRAEVSDIAMAVREGADALYWTDPILLRFPLKAVNVMHAVALRTESDLVAGETPANLGQAFENPTSEMFAFYATKMANNLGTPIVVFTRTAFMAILLSHYRPSSTIFAFTNEYQTTKKELILPMHTVLLILQTMPFVLENFFENEDESNNQAKFILVFSDDAEETFTNAMAVLQKQGTVKEGEHVALVRTGRQPIWRFESTHNIQIRKV